MPPKMRFETPIFHPNSEPLHHLSCILLLATCPTNTAKSTRTAKSASRSSTRPKKTSTATNLPPNAGPPSKHPKPFSSPSYPCCRAQTTSRPLTSRLQACGGIIQQSSRSACASVSGIASSLNEVSRNNTGWGSAPQNVIINFSKNSISVVQNISCWQGP